MNAFAVPLPNVGVRATDRDSALVEAMAAGNAVALEALYERHGRHILAYLVGQLSAREVAEEVLQDVFLAAWRGAGSFRGESKALTWLLTIAHNRAVNARRNKQWNDARLDSHGHAALDTGDPRLGGDNHADLRSALRRLPSGQQAALELVFYHGLSIAETAAVLGVAQGTVKSRIHRAKTVLRDHLGDGSVAYG